MPKEEVLDLLKARDPRGAEELLAHYGPLMRYIIAPILPDPRDREECLNEVVLRIWEKISLYSRGSGSFTGWLTALTRNAALNYARKIHPASEDLTEDIPSPEPTPEELVLRQERQRALMDALDQLYDGDRVLFYRKYYYMQSTAQIAAETGMTVRAVEGRLYRLKQHLRRKLGGEGYD